MEFGSRIRIWMVLAMLFQAWKDSKSQKIQSSYSLQMESSVVIEEGQCATVPCRFTANNRDKFTSSHGYWMSDLETTVASNDESFRGTKPNFHLKGNTDTGDCTLMITKARKTDSGTYFFRFEENRETINKFNYMANKFTVQVSDLIQKPEITVLGEMVANQEVTLTCSLPGSCPEAEPVITWWADNTKKVWENSMSITITPSLNDHLTSMTCEWAFPDMGTYTRGTIVLDVQYPPEMTITTVLNSSEISSLPGHTLSVSEGDSVTLKCSVDSNPAADVTWTKGARTAARSMTGQGLELFLTPVMAGDADTYSCSAWNKHGDTSDFVVIDVDSTNGGPNSNLHADASPGPERVTAASPLFASRNIDYIILGGLIAGNLLILSLIALGLFCMVRRNMNRRQQGIINDGQELSSQGSASAYKMSSYMPH